jgi:hypothetical protein
MIAFITAFAPKRDRESRYEAESEVCIALCGEPRDLLVENVDGASRKNAGSERKMCINGRCVSDQSVKRVAREGGEELAIDAPSRPSRDARALDLGDDADLGFAAYPRRNDKTAHG